MMARDTSLDSARLWERLRQEIGLSGAWSEAPAEARALVASVSGAGSAEDVAACEAAGAALAREVGALDRRLDDLQRWSDALAVILEDALAGEHDALLAAQQAL